MCGVRARYTTAYSSTRPVNQPYAELNWYYNFNDYEMSFDGESLAIDGAKNIFELKVGYEKQVGNSVQLWGNVFGGWGSNGYKSYGFTAGAKYSF
ncbi:autotransporter outer membrane beta-barrel domain-containing protein [Veillonella sp. YH-vei2232]|uniref:Autotransporter outer membrane beta-barrel domain-containing protein n=1 Tax=Veillonella absiana TaxID=3079305 RepID=A0ABU3Z801_9FIRM|nr:MULTISPECIES: autotransporter outer membrane beta-barrel domain-containing protein [unclassified Veillonella]MDV5062636.1 autotransporter outer membrane beta-barrel domain-containing protein [Veillonella sp. YH-vei2232]MDV5088045.1 autotransporter outer membrane beta-barrel domain-containing protein [Veillonella sp. YH-vei2233]